MWKAWIKQITWYWSTWNFLFITLNIQTKKKVVQNGFLEELINVNIECDEGNLNEMNTKFELYIDERLLMVILRNGRKKINDKMTYGFLSGYETVSTSNFFFNNLFILFFKIQIYFLFLKRNQLSHAYPNHDLPRKYAKMVLYSFQVVFCMKIGNLENTHRNWMLVL